MSRHSAGASFNAGEARLIESISTTLAHLPAGGAAAGIFDAIAPAVPVAAGMLNILKPGAPDALVSHPVRMPQALVESWMNSPAEHLERALTPILCANDGELRRDAETIQGDLRERFEALQQLDVHGLGEGAGYKVLTRPLPGGGAEHIMLTLLSERGARFEPDAAPLLAALGPSLRDAILRLRLPLVHSQPLFAQIIEEEALGYVCLSRGGAVLEANRRAHAFAARYRALAGITAQRGALADLATRALVHASFGRPWQLVDRARRATLDLHVHKLAREVHVLPEDVLLVVLRESSFPPDSGVDDALARLTPRQREIAFLLGRSGLSYKEMAARLAISTGTLRKHAEHVYRELGVHSRAELSALFQ